jgi:hypothetical protein
MSGQALSNLQPVHELQISGAQAWRTLAAIAQVMDEGPAELIAIHGRKFADGGSAWTVKIAGVAPDEARALSASLAQSPGVNSARVEHVLWRAQP